MKLQNIGDATKRSHLTTGDNTAPKALQVSYTFTMTFITTKTLFAVTIASLVSTCFADQGGTNMFQPSCSIGMTKFVETPQEFNSILINPTCSSEGFFTTTKLAWTIEPLEDEDAQAAIFSYPPEAVKATLDQDTLIFDLNDMGEVPEKAGVVIQVPKWQLRHVTIDGVDNHVRVAPGFPNILSLSSLGMGSYIHANMTESLYAKLNVDASNSAHFITGEYISFRMHSVSSKVHIEGSILGGEYEGFDGQVSVTGRVRDLSVDGNKNYLAAGDCDSVVLDSPSASCTILEEGEVAIGKFEDIPCTYEACKQRCVSTNYGYCHCTEDCNDEETDDSPSEPKDTDKSTSAASSTGVFAIVALAIASAFAF